VRLFFTGEAQRPDMEEADYAFGFDHEEYINHPGYMRMPLFAFDVVCEQNFDLAANQFCRLGVKPQAYVADVMNKKSKFCCFISSHPTRMRRLIFEELSKYKNIDSYGSFLRNVKMAPAHDRSVNISMMEPYKFAITFEHSEYPGYATEKTYRAMLADAIPICWGNDLISRDFNTGSFISYYDFENDHERRVRRCIYRFLYDRMKPKSPILACVDRCGTAAFRKFWNRSESFLLSKRVIRRMVDRIIAVDRDDRLYANYLTIPWHHGNESTVSVFLNRMEERLRQIFGL
jgi:alpha(1,3/1,4) fucosyltransferase